MQLNKYIDHTILKPDATEEEIIRIVDEAKAFNFASVCVNQYYTKLVADRLAGTEVKTCTVIGFPLGMSDTEVKKFEAEAAIAAGADEIDMVINVAALKDGKLDYVAREIKAIVKVCSGRALLKVIVETCLLSREQKETIARIVTDSGADYIKTSTGFSSGGATVEDIKLFNSIINNRIKIKASGGIRDKNTAIAMIEAGASRIGASASVKICSDL